MTHNAASAAAGWRGKGEERQRGNLVSVGLWGESILAGYWVTGGIRESAHTHTHSLSLRPSG